ncbi:TonB-dependent receptor [Luteimonas sp. Y-2-2-4F]|nr:TonB-dependent receptor [Luteimonas sp. Y-2-2-4F]MCD9032693.1 TonB-dependent receptor [Luteimonas sp. Y-2-2-4F]
MGNREPHVRFSRLSHCLMLSLAVAAAGALPHAHVHAQSRSSTAAMVDFDIPAGELSVALDRFAEQSGLQVVSEQPLLQDVKVQAVRGRYAAEDALGRLLSGSGLGYQRINAQTLVLKKQAVAPAPRPETRSSPASGPPAQGEAQELSGITVTGTRIRGGSTPSPVITIGAERITEEGFSDLGEVIRSLPQNFSGGQNPGIVAGAEGGGIGNQNISGGSALNLRGLGPDATLTLLNGRRLAYSGFVQAVDIDAIPVEAVDRLEIIPDGASAIYGSDAVGGVGNVILRRDYDGLTVGARYGGATDGGLGTRSYTVTGGANWMDGGFIATWKDSSVDPIYSDQRRYTRHLDGPTTLYPRSELRSGLFSGHQWLGNRVELRLDALRTERDQLTYYPAYPTQYIPATAESTMTFVSPSIEVSLAHDWMLSLGATWGRDDTISGLGLVNRATGVETRLASTRYRNTSVSYEIGAEGPLFTLPAGDVRLAAGAGYRRNEFVQGSLLSGAVATDGDDASRFAYAEINLPLIGADNNIPGVERLALTAAVRGEDYDSSGGVTTPKLGVVYAPNADVTVTASWGRSFKAPTLLQLHQMQSAYLYSAAALGGSGYPADATVLVPYGGNPDLDPERARTWSASIRFHPEALPALEMELGWFDIDLSGRIAQPLVYQAQALSNPAYAGFIDYSPTAEEQASIIASSQFSNFTGMPYDPQQVVAIAFNRYINTVAQRVKGLDFSGSYRIDLGAGRMTFHGALSWLDSAQRATVNDHVADLSGMLFYPAKLSGRIGAVWSQGGLSASTFANYADGVTNSVDGSKGASFTTLDTTLRYTTDERHGAWSGLDLALSASNLLDRAPPLYVPTSSINPPYDSTNYSPVGRFLSISVSKHW